MIKEFEGKSEKEAIAKAMNELQLNDGDFEVEILSEEEEKKFGFFKRHNVKIRVHFNQDKVAVSPTYERRETGEEVAPSLEQSGELMAKANEFLEKVISLMGYEAKVSSDILEGRFCFDIETENSAILIGKQGRNLDALQLIVSVYVGRIGSKLENVTRIPRVVIDTQNYRQRREESVIRDAVKNAEQVVKMKSSRLLDPMTASERRLVHTALGDRNDIITQSEGEGDMRQVRIIYKGSR